jgi:hypothetical protein
MSRIVVVILIYHRHKPVGLTLLLKFTDCMVAEFKSLVLRRLRLSGVE